MGEWYSLSANIYGAVFIEETARPFWSGYGIFLPNEQ